MTVCACASDSDCALFEDGDLCNGTLYCDKSGKSPACKLNPSTPKVCPSVEDTACIKNKCQAKSGICANKAMAAGAPCDDGQACTGGDGCDSSGVCVAGSKSLCGCKLPSDCAAFDDGDVCNGGFDCKGGACLYNGKVLVCDDGSSCTTDSCDKASGCKNVVLPTCATCTDDKGCDDGNLCSYDLCVGGQCKWLANELTCGTGDSCKAADVCKDTLCKAGATKSCDDANPCTDDSCEPKLGCAHVANSVGCDVDGSVCTSDTCAASACKGGATLSCDDGNPCTDDSCDATTGCGHVNSQKPCNDGDACTSGETCKVGACVGTGAAVVCDDKKECTVDSCDKTKGCVYDAAPQLGKECGEGTNWTCKIGFCTFACPYGFEQVEVNDGAVKKKACAALGPVWGLRPAKPVGVYTVSLVGSHKVVVDSQTKLMWQQESSSSTWNWANAKTYCDGLVYAGYGDWRLPWVHELATLVDYTIAPTGPTIDQTAFPGTKKAWYWAAQLRTGNSNYAWDISFDEGRADTTHTVTHPNEVRCVRGNGSFGWTKRYQLSAGGGVVTDTWTKLQWVRVLKAGKRTWQGAKDYCAALSLEGATDWRVPDVRELHSLGDTKLGDPAIDNAAFPNAPPYKHWCARKRAGSADRAWGIGFLHAYIFNDPDDSGYEVRCVR